jgi:hypothetical protein
VAENNILSGLKLDHWYKALVAVGGLGMIATVTGKIEFMSSQDVFMLFLSFFLFGIGQWINHPSQAYLVRPSVYAPHGGQLKGYARSPTKVGKVFEVLGVLLFSDVMSIEFVEK